MSVHPRLQRLPGMLAAISCLHFVQWDLGFSRQDRELYGRRRWKRLEARLLDFLDSGRPLTVSAEGKSYELPAIRIRGWKERFKKIC